MLSSGDGANNLNFSGRRLDKAPSSTVSLGYTRSWDFESGAQVSANVNHRWSAKYEFLDPGTATVAAHVVEQKAFGKTDLSLTYSAPDDAWSLQAWVRNVEDHIVITGMFNNVGSNYAFVGEPRTYGLRFATRF